MLNQKDILQTQDMIDKRHLDIRTITMGINLLDCADTDVNACADTRRAFALGAAPSLPIALYVSSLWDSISVTLTPCSAR